MLVMMSGLSMARYRSHMKNRLLLPDSEQMTLANGRREK